MQKVTNIRGWLKSINNHQEIAVADEKGFVELGAGDLFGFQINYDTPNNATALFNGNISETYWKTATDNQLRNYAYVYDSLNRLKDANYYLCDSGSEYGAYNESLSYDKNGNILSLTRNSLIQEYGANTIDNLGYTYNGNQLLKVDDSTNSPAGFKNGTNAGNDYTYDANGNMITDQNKGILGIEYNHLNLPKKITFANGGIISYFYNALGQKVAKEVSLQTSSTKTDYLGGYQYVSKNGGAFVLQFFPTAEGYVKKTRNYYSYVYNYTDHLGNVRLSYTKDPQIGDVTILEENNYYPFGLKHQVYNSSVLELQFPEEQPMLIIGPKGAPQSVMVPEFVSNTFMGDGSYQYKYNGKEFQDELGLNVTAMDYRQYDGAIGRFNSVDVLSELAPHLTPYRYAFNNPVYWNDPTGLLEGEPENTATCPTCPNLPAFQPYINDPNTDYVYDPITGEVSVQLREVEVVVKQSDSKTSDPLFWINAGLGISSTYVGFKANFHIQNELWHLSKNGTLHTIFDENWNKNKIKNVRNFQTSKLQLPRNISNVLARASLVMVAVNVGKTGELKASDVLNTTMAAISFTGIGSVVAGVYFVADLATMGTSYLIEGEAKSIGDYLDENTNGGVILDKNDFK